MQPKKYTSSGLSYEELDRGRVEAMQSVKAMELSIEEFLMTASDANSELNQFRIVVDLIISHFRVKVAGVLFLQLVLLCKIFVGKRHLSLRDCNVQV